MTQETQTGALYQLRGEGWGASWEGGKKKTKLQTELAYGPAIPLLGIYPDKSVFQSTQAPLCLQQHYSESLNMEGNY